MKAYIHNGWDKNIVDPDPDKKYTQARLAAVAVPTDLQSYQLQSAQSNSSDESSSWPKGPYTQQIVGVLPPLLTDDIILTHLQASGEQFKPKKKTSSQSTNIDYSTLQRGYQYFMEGYIPGRYVMFCLKDGVAWIKARCYHSQKKHDAMHEVRVAITSEYPCCVTNAVCSCVAGKAGVCSHVIGLLKQIIHYVMMKFKAVPDDLCCTQMQQTWHKPRSVHIEAEPVMTVTFCKAKQVIDNKKTPAVCSLYEARASVIQEYNHEQQLKLKEGLVLNKPTCAFAQILMNSSAEHLITTPFGAVPYFIIPEFRV